MCFAFIACTGPADKTNNLPVTVDFTETRDVKKEFILQDSLKPLKVAIAGVISPKETIVYYEEMIRYISDHMRRPIQIEQRKTYGEINDRIASNQIDFGFVCSGAFVEAIPKNTMEILVVPVVQGEPFYRAYVITYDNSGIHRFEDFERKSFAFTDPLSNTGYFYAADKVKNLGSSVETFFSKTLFTYAHDYSIQMVSKKLVDGATVDGLIYEYLKKFTPERVRDIVILEKSEKYGIPPVVIPKYIDRATKEQLRKIFVEMSDDKEGKKILDKLMIDRFQPGDVNNYSTIKVIK
jgi:phosphonate transport system substrate-binding protein